MLGENWKGYYLTAYGIAVKHGFRGTEEEWLSSLEGKPGAAAELRYNKNAKAIEWRPEGSDTWEAIVPLSELQGELVSATLSEAEEAAKNAGTAKADAMAAAVAAKKDAMAAAEAEKKILSHIEEYGTTVKKVYVSGDVLYIQTSDGKVFSAGDVRGRKGDTGNSGVYIGTEEPEDPEVKVWIDPSGHDGMRELINTLSRLKYTEGGVQVDLSDYAKGVDWAQDDETAANFVKNRTHYGTMKNGKGEKLTTLNFDEFTEEKFSLQLSVFTKENFFLVWPDGTEQEFRTVEEVIVPSSPGVLGKSKYWYYPVEEDSKYFSAFSAETGRSSITTFSKESVNYCSYCDVYTVKENSVLVAEKKLDEIYIPDNIKQPDWKQNDERAAGYIKNRTHYEEVEYKNITFDLSEELWTRDDFTGLREATLSPPDIKTLYDSFVRNCRGNIPLEVSFKGYGGDKLTVQLTHENEGQHRVYEAGDRVYLKLYDGEVSIIIDKYILNVGCAGALEYVSFNGLVWRHDIKQLDERFIPDTIARADLSNADENACRNLGAAQFVDLGFEGTTLRHNPMSFDYYVAVCNGGDLGENTLVFSNVSSPPSLGLSDCRVAKLTIYESAVLITYLLQFNVYLDGLLECVTETQRFNISAGQESIGNFRIEKLYGVKLPK